MFESLIERLRDSWKRQNFSDWLERSESRRVDDYLAGSADLAEIERRMRHLERNGYPIR
jgi:hypothetical protein